MDYPVCYLTWMCFEQDFSFNAGKNYPRADITLEEQGGPSQVSGHSPKKEVPPDGPPALEPSKELPSQPEPSNPAEQGAWISLPSSKQPLSPDPKRTFQALQESGEDLVPKEGGRPGRQRSGQPPWLTGMGKPRCLSRGPGVHVLTASRCIRLASHSSFFLPQCCQLPRAQSCGLRRTPMIKSWQLCW